MEEQSKCDSKCPAEPTRYCTYSYLGKYKLFLLAKDYKLAKQTLKHIMRVLNDSPWKVRLQILTIVILPTLEELSQCRTELTELEVELAQTLLYIVEKIVDGKDILGDCCGKKKFLKTIARFTSMGTESNTKHSLLLVDNAYQCVFGIVKAEVKRCLR